MKNKLIDVHNMLMATLEDLDDESLLEKENSDKLEQMLKVAKTKCYVTEMIVEVDRMSLEAIKVAENHALKTSDVFLLEDK